MSLHSYKGSHMDVSYAVLNSDISLREKKVQFQRGWGTVWSSREEVELLDHYKILSLLRRHVDDPGRPNPTAPPAEFITVHIFVTTLDNSTNRAMYECTLPPDIE